MKTVIKLLSLVILLLMLQGARAQDVAGTKTQTPEERAQVITAWMKENLSLDEVQLAKVGAINLKYARMNEPVLKDGGSRFSKFKKLRSNQNEKDKELKSVFTPDQFDRYLSLEKELKDKIKNRKSQ